MAEEPACHGEAALMKANVPERPASMASKARYERSMVLVWYNMGVNRQAGHFRASEGDLDSIASLAVQAGWK